jgi:hypothetical protein
MIGGGLAGLIGAATLAATASAVQAAPPTLTDESFHEDLPTITALHCAQPSTFSYSSTGTAAGPYPGTYTETGTLTSTDLSASFTIDSPTGTVTGTKTGGAGFSCATNADCSSAAECESEGAAFNTLPGGVSATDTYQATIIVPGGGAFSDSGLFGDVFYHSEHLDSPLNGFDSTFQSELSSPVFTGPTTVGECRDGGWRDLGFPNQGRCIAVVRHQAGP